MKKNIILFALFFFVFSQPKSRAADESNPDDRTGESLKDDAFVVETNEETAADSLNRISGKYDLGFASSEQSYHSPHHYKPVNQAIKEDTVPPDANSS